ncbi:hypothetical protein [Bacillus amyloliquefaciens]|uniref:hypothetical protein n=1 Tax=Bacillus amyloliquefaciens TaxID=1390 RepID=UPI002DFD1674|nr:hypothetical protein [Bacillus amyloliquefaciens]
MGNCEIIKERLKNKDKDKKLLGKVYEEKNKLFPNRVKELRKKNGLWIDDDFRQDHEGNSKGDKKNENNDQISLSLE